MRRDAPLLVVVRDVERVPQRNPVAAGESRVHRNRLSSSTVPDVGFATLFSGVISGYLAAGATGALLTFGLPVTIPAPNAAIPDRLEGWGLASGAGICAVMLLWPPRRGADLERAAAAALRAVADLLAGDRERV